MFLAAAGQRFVDLRFDSLIARENLRIVELERPRREQFIAGLMCIAAKVEPRRR
jgi:hypothetical protein